MTQSSSLAAHACICEVLIYDATTRETPDPSVNSYVKDSQFLRPEASRPRGLNFGSGVLLNGEDKGDSTTLSAFSCWFSVRIMLKSDTPAAYVAITACEPWMGGTVPDVSAESPWEAGAEGTIGNLGTSSNVLYTVRELVKRRNFTIAWSDSIEQPSVFSESGS